MGRWQSTFRLLGEDGPMRSRSATALAPAVLLLVLAALLTGCGGGADEPAAHSSAPAPSPSPSAAKPVPQPAADACYPLTFQQAVAPTSTAKPRPCSKPHTSETYDVGRLANVVDGHLLAVDSEQVQHQVTQACSKPLTRYLGGSIKSLRLSMLRPVWFTPSVDESEQGASWYRCDVIAIAGPDKLMRIKGRVKGALGNAQTAERYAMCSTAKPGNADFTRVPCSSSHSWKAISTVDLPPGKYPGEKAAENASVSACRDAARSRAEDALKFEWGHEWPTAKQWAAGQTYDICWAED